MNISKAINSRPCGDFTPIHDTFLFDFTFCCWLASCTETSVIEIKDEKTLYSTELDYGVFILSPQGFKKAKSYVGLQAPNHAGSIEVRMENDFEEQKIFYSKESIESRDGKVYRLQPVIYGQNRDAFYVEFYDNPQKRYRQVLVISKDDRVYKIKSFHRGKANYALSNTIRMALMTVYIDDYVKKELPFSIAYSWEPYKKIYTRDNKYKTEEPDSLVVSVEDFNSTEVNDSNAKSFLKERVHEICDGQGYVLRDRLENGYLLKYKTECSSKKVLGILLLGNDNHSTFIQCVGNQKADLKDVGNIMINKFIYIK